MNAFLPVIIAILCISAFALVLVLFGGKRKERSQYHHGRKIHHKDRNTIIKEANRRLASNPKDAEANLAIGDLYYREQAWDKAAKTYEILADLCGSSPELDEFEINFRYGIASIRLQKLDDAYKAFLIAHSLKQDNFEVCFNLGYLEFQKRAYEKAVLLLKQAVSMNSEHALAMRYYGHTLFRLKNYRDALTALKRAADLEPEDKESLFTMAETFFELGQSESAIKLFNHLRTDPALGPNAALFAGTIHMNQRQYPKAIMDFEIGLKHPSIKIETLVELKYRLAAAYLKTQDIGRAVSILNDVQATYPNYKDVGELIARYKELYDNRNLQVYMISQTSDFVTLCRRLVASFFPDAKVKITDISVIRNEYADILADIEAKKWQDDVLFRFIRTTGTVGEFTLRDMYAKIKEVKAGKGFCLTAGQFSEEAKRFVEARLIDLIEKPALIRILNTVDSASPVSLI